jgi:hypothetical protein
MKTIRSIVTFGLCASALGMGACAAQSDTALGVEAEAVSNGPCHVDCDCVVGSWCPTSGATAGICTFDDGFGPPPTHSICFGTCQCPSGEECINSACQAGPFPIVPVSGSWYNPARSGWGLAVSNNNLSGDSGDFYSDIVVTWYTYTANAVPIWYAGTLAPGGGVYTGTLYSGQYLPASRSTTSTTRGQMTLATKSATTGTFSWVLDGVAGSQPVERMAFGGAGSAPRLTGQWLAYTPIPAYPLGGVPIDMNLFFDVQGNTAVADVALYNSVGQPTWVYGSGTAGTSGFTLSLLRVTGTNLYPGSVGPPSSSYQSMGTLTVEGINAADSSANFVLTLPTSYEPQVSSTQPMLRQTD